MADFLELIMSPWAMRALVASVLVGLMLGMLGTFIVLRNMSLIGDALAHSVLPGVIVAFMIMGIHSLSLFIGAVIAGLICAFVITWIQKQGHAKNDAAIGIVYTAMFSIGVIAISAISRKDGVHVDLKDFLFGNILGVSNEDLWLSSIIFILIVAAILLFYRHLFVSTFQEAVAKVMGVKVDLVHYFLLLLLSFAVVASLRTVGIILVVAMLITPASTALLLSSNMKRVIFISAIIGMISAAGGLMLAIILDTTPGPVMAVLSALIYGMAVVFAPERGKLAQWIHQRRLADRIVAEDIMKYLLKQGGRESIIQVSSKLELSASSIRRHVGRMSKNGVIDQDSEELVLTQDGEDRASQLIRAHRLWETYLVNQVGMSESQIHLEAEELEHHLSEDVLDHVDELLGFPDSDPHGSPIPSKRSTLGTVLAQLSAGTKAMVKGRQLRHAAMQYLWESEIAPHSELEVLAIENGQVTLKVDGDRTVSLPHELAEQLEVVPD